MTPISPLDLLTLHDSEQTIVHTLTRQPGQTLSELATKTNIPTHKLEALLRDMVQSGLVVEQLHEGDRRFSVRFSDQRRKRNLPPAFLELIESKATTILANASLTSGLTDQVHQALLAKSKTRRLLPNEVYGWQSESTQYVGLLTVGLLKKSQLGGRQSSKSTTGYVRRGEWLGLSEGLSGVGNHYTFTAVTEATLLLWTIDDFVMLSKKYPSLGVATSQFLSEHLQNCYNQQQTRMGMLWVVESLHRGAGATTLAINLALLAAQAEHDHTGKSRARVALWSTQRGTLSLLPLLEKRSVPKEKLLPGQKSVLRHESGLDILLETERGDYPPMVELDILLTTLQKHYDYIICDTGSETANEFILRLRGRAQTLITMTRDPEGVGEATKRWATLKPYAPPGQRRVLTLNGPLQKKAVVGINPAFHLVLPHADTSLEQAAEHAQALIEYSPNHLLSNAFREVYRRLSLTQTVAIFIPSTVDVDTVVENEVQVKAALSFLGDLFGGATSSDASGVWKSEESDLVVEKVSIVRSFVSEKALKRHLDDVIAFAGQIKEEMKQEAVAIDVNNELVLI